MNYDARAFNGGPDDEPNFSNSGPRREPEKPVEYPIGKPCGFCALPIHRVYSLSGVGVFCSPKCRTRAADAVERANEQADKDAEIRACGGYENWKRL